MAVFSRSEDSRRKDINSLLVLKSKLNQERVKLREDFDSKKADWMEQKMDDILFRLREMEKKLEGVRRERIHDLLEYEKMTKTPGRDKPESIRTLKVKSMVKSLLEEHGKLASTDLMQLLKLSRTRCNEYLVELEREGVVQGATVRRKKFYSLKK
ncbi:MAG: winged helix-turn-helix domain-containing protein [Candidatus Thorarchaeota archaeon]|jgi:Fic family protein